jgi:23S rRNA (pseudouridine1915-N3)-methyltransferase
VARRCARLGRFLTAGVRIAVLAVGKVKQAGLRAELDDYFGRVRRYAPCDEIELKDGADVELVERFKRALPPRARTVALEVDGRAMTSAQLSELVATAQRDAVGCLAFLIGGAYGLPRELSRDADLRLSLSAMTLPHRLARLVLAEQIYRAFTLLRGEPYSH